MTTAMLWPVTTVELARSTVATSYVLRVTMNAVTEDLTTPTLTAGRYYWLSGDAQADGDGGVGGVGDLAAILRTTLLTHSEATTVVTTLTSDNRLSYDMDVIATTILWSHANTTLSALPFGWTQADTSSDAIQEAPNQTMGAWCPLRDPTIDSRDIAAYTTGTAVALSGLTRIARHAQARAKRDLSYNLLAQRYAIADYADANEPYGTAEHVWQYALSRGYPVRYYEDPSSRTANSYTLYRYRGEDARGDDRTDVVDRDPGFRVRWAVSFPLRRATL